MITNARIEVIPTSGARKVLDPNTYLDFFSQVLDAIAIVVDSIIKSEGFCPVDTGRLRGGHSLKLIETLTKYITNAVYYWVFVVYGHRVFGAKTPAQRKAFFAKLEKGWARGARPLGYAGYVPPNNYLLRAIVHAFQGGYVQRIIDQKIREALR